MSRVRYISIGQLLLLALLLLLLAGCNRSNVQNEPVADPEQAAASIMELAGTAWVLDYVGEPEAEMDAIEGSRSTLNFSFVNYAGSGGCNWYQGVYEASAPSLTLNPPFQTRLSCSDPEDIMEQEGTFFGALLQATDYMLEDDKLVLSMNGNEQRLLTFSPAADVDFEGTNWGLKLYYDGQSWFPVILQTEITALFEDGQLSGSAGCNEYEARYEVDVENLTIMDVVAGEEECSEPVEIMAQETIVLAALEMVARYEVQGGVLTLYDGSGSPLLYFGSQ